MCHPTAPAHWCDLGREERREERADSGDVQIQGMLWLPMRGLAPSWRAARYVDNVNKMHVGQDSMNRVEYSEWFAWKIALIAQGWVFSGN